MELNKQVFVIARDRVATDINVFSCNAIRRAVVQVYKLDDFESDNHPIVARYISRFRGVAEDMWLGEQPPFWDRCGWMEEMDADGNHIDRTDEYREMRLTVFDKILKGM